MALNNFPRLRTTEESKDYGKYNCGNWVASDAQKDILEISRHVTGDAAKQNGQYLGHVMLLDELVQTDRRGPSFKRVGSDEARNVPRYTRVLRFITSIPDIYR
jgi:hypothetical protein